MGEMDVAYGKSVKLLRSEVTSSEVCGVDTARE